MSRTHLILSCGTHAQLPSFPVSQFQLFIIFLAKKKMPYIPIGSSISYICLILTNRET